MLPVGPAFYPRIVLGLTALLAAWLVVADLLARGHRPPPSAARPNYALVALAFVTFTAYVLALPWLGFRLATFAFLVALPAVLERPRAPRRWALIAVIALFATVIVYFVFER